MNHRERLLNLFPSLLNKAIRERFSKYRNITISGGGNYSSKPFLLADVFREEKCVPNLWIVNDRTEQEHVAQACVDWFGIPVLHFEMLENEHLDKSIVLQNHVYILEAIKTLMEKEKKIIVAPYLNLMQATPSLDEIKKKTLNISLNEDASIVNTFERLIGLGYKVSQDAYLEKGKYLGTGNVLTVFPINKDYPVRIEFDFDKVASIIEFNQETGDVIREPKHIKMYPLNLAFDQPRIFEFMPKDSIVVDDELEVIDEFYDEWDKIFGLRNNEVRTITFTSFPEDDEKHINLRYLSVLKYQDLLDLAGDLKEKHMQQWEMVFFTKHKAEIAEILKDKKVPFVDTFAPFNREPPYLRVIEVDKDYVVPHAFQNADQKIIVVTDREIANLKTEKRIKATPKVFWEFLSGLKVKDLVVHIDHGIARFEGLERRMVDGVTREYMKLAYAENDKLYVPIDQADKVNKFIGAEDEAPRLTRLGSAEWSTITRKVKKETEKIAKELLELYARRKKAKGFVFSKDAPDQKEFEKTFPYEETPGQIKAIEDVKQDMESTTVMDRLICGDVGFGKTEVAMRAAFKAMQSKKQVALISPITILADQHYRSFKKRMDAFHIRVEMLSRFRTPSEQKEILKRLERGEVDIIIGTHRLLQSDVKFKDLGLVVIDEEQRFGVKQKEKFKEMRTEVDILTLTATPIPRTLNICLNKLRDITTITTPPPGRLPVVTEVRKFSNDLIREAILRELKRGGQIYFLHNRVQTIDSVAERLRILIPEARFGVAHGKLISKELEKIVIDFKDKKFDVLVSSAIIENGIDLPNANTLIVNNAERFGLAQLYQLRGRVGRGKAQAYAYFLYHSQRLHLDAKKRLRAIVEASELGSGFQIAMKDLEIRGAGDILGVSQHGVINVVGVSHFIRMLNRAVEELEAGGGFAEGKEEEQQVSIELPLTAYIPDNYIVSAKEKINAYQRMSAADKMDYFNELKDDLVEEYGKPPREVMNLFRVIELKILAKQAGLTLVKAENVHMRGAKQIILYMGKKVKPENIVHLLEFNDKWKISGNKLITNLENLGVQWFDGLRECVAKLGEKISRPGENNTEKTKKEPVQETSIANQPS